MDLARTAEPWVIATGFVPVFEQKIQGLFKDFPAPTAIFKDFQGLDFIFKIQGFLSTFKVCANPVASYITYLTCKDLVYGKTRQNEKKQYAFSFVVI